MLKPTNNFLASAMPTFAGMLGYGYAGPGSPGNALVRRVSQLLSRGQGVQGPRPDPYGQYAPERDTEGGVAGAASPSLAGYQNSALLGQRSALSAELWLLYATDARFKRSVDKRCSRAVRGGFRFEAAARDGTGARVAKRAQAVGDGLLRRTGMLGLDGTPDKAVLAKWIKHGRMDADLFLQRIVAFPEADENGLRGAGQVVALKVMPGPQMFKETDDRGRFFDVARAYVQIDEQTKQPVDYFAAWQIGHYPWMQLGEDRYGQCEYAGARAPARSLQISEMAQEYRRTANSGRIIDHAIGAQDGSGGETADIKAYQKQNGVGNDAVRAATNPLFQFKQFFHNALAKITVHPSDPNVHEIADLEYSLDKAQCAYGTPAQVLGYSLAGVARDTVDLVIGEWLEDLEDDLAWVLLVLLDTIRFQLLLEGIDPDSLLLSVAPPAEGLATAADTILFINKAMTNSLGAGMNARPFPLLTAETAVALLAKWIGVRDAEAYVGQLLQMMTEHSIDPDSIDAQQQQMMQGRTGGTGGSAGVGAANSKNAPGGATTGYGSKFEGGKTRDGSASGGDNYRKAQK